MECASELCMKILDTTHSGETMVKAYDMAHRCARSSWYRSGMCRYRSILTAPLWKSIPLSFRWYASRTDTIIPRHMGLRICVATGDACWIAIRVRQLDFIDAERWLMTNR